MLLENPEEMAIHFKHFRFVHVFTLLLLFLVGFEFVSLVVCRPDTNGLEGKYFDNLEWQGDPSIISLDHEISSETLRIQREKLPQNRYTVEWTGYIDILETETYTFFLESDDGSWLFIDEKLVVDNGGVHGLFEKEGTIHLRKGVYRIKIRYLQAGGYAVLRLFWKKGEAAKTLLSNVYLYPPDTSSLYQIGQTFLPYIIVFSGILIIIIGDSILNRDGHEE
jgi:fibro-slime domain-containing protein